MHVKCVEYPHMSRVHVDQVPHSVEYVTSRVCHAWNIMLHALHTEDVTYSTLHGTWSPRTRVMATRKYTRVKMKL